MFKKTSNCFWEHEPKCWFWSIEEPDLNYFIEQLKYHKMLYSNHCETMLCDIKEDDLIVVKNIPDRKHFTLVKAVGNYQFKSKGLEDFLPIEILGEFYKYSKIVPPSLLRTLRQQHNLIDMANSKQRHIIATLSSQILESYEPVNVIIELWQRAEEYLGRAGAIVIFLFTVVEIISAVEGTVVDYAEFKAIIDRWYWALR
ncbi:hypothetical protein QUF50_00290 [Thiotrichales bacterium HSG1]|nr:hypothetical protein [Thiotrichales bacterium HSG1]